MTSRGIDITADVCRMNNVRPLNPPGDQYHTVCWVQQGFGVAPGSASGGTSYILGHSWSQAPLVFNPISELATAEINRGAPEMQSGVPTFPVRGLDGAVITLTTPTGELTYTVSRAFAVSKHDAGSVASVVDESVPDRVTLITCAVAGSTDVDDNIIVDAFLTSSHAR